MANRPRSKFIGFFRLIEACDQQGCPVCRCLLADAQQYLGSLLYEQVTDPDTRRRLRASWGFCSWHASLLREVSDPAFGSAILSEDLLRAAIRLFERRGSDLVKRRRRALRGFDWMGRRATHSLLAELYRRRAVCPGCELIARSEEHYVRVVLEFVDDPQFDRAYRRSQGLCVPHTVEALELGAAGPEVQQLVARTLSKWVELARELDGFIGKHDYRNRRPFTEAESDAHRRALAVLAGMPGLFGNDVRRA